MKAFKKIVTFIVLMALVSTIAVPVFAASKRPYKDVINNVTVLPMDYKAIKLLKKHGAYKNVVKGNYFYPEKPVTRKEFLKIAINVFGKRYVPITKTDKKKYKKYISNFWIFDKLNAVSKKMGGVTLSLPAMKYSPVERDFASYLIVRFARECKLKKKWFS